MRLEGDERDVKAEFVKGGATRGGREMSFVDVEGYVEGASLFCKYRGGSNGYFSVIPESPNGLKCTFVGPGGRLCPNHLKSIKSQQCTLGGTLRGRRF